MKVLIALFLSVFLTVNLFGMPLVFKLKKSIPNNEETDLAIVDTSDYKPIRINVKSRNTFDYSRLTPEQKKKGYNFNNLWVYQIEDDEQFILWGQSTSQAINQSFILEAPPAKVVIKVRGAGDYSLFVYGQ